ncbi:hypothetical protein ACFPH6_33640 [Streptomyces xiangluensis]|uniref:Uncharacterized protein n=1 Tax=Streptomyces xiangluensis TaxID=2665720 RepID=A0ABV8YXR3_9ACTN
MDLLADLPGTGADLVGTERNETLGMGVRIAGAADDVRAAAPGELDGVTADTTGRTGDQDAPAEQRTDAVQGAQRAGARHGNGADGAGVGSLGDGPDHVGVHSAQFGPSASLAEGDDRCAGRGSRAVRRRPLDDPRGVPAEYGPVRRIAQP